MLDLGSILSQQSATNEESRHTRRDTYTLDQGYYDSLASILGGAVQAILQRGSIPIVTGTFGRIPPPETC